MRETGTPLRAAGRNVAWLAGPAFLLVATRWEQGCTFHQQNVGIDNRRAGSSVLLDCCFTPERLSQPFPARLWRVTGGQRIQRGWIASSGCCSKRLSCWSMRNSRSKSAGAKALCNLEAYDPISSWR